jgi:hypothetical protein
VAERRSSPHALRRSRATRLEDLLEVLCSSAQVKVRSGVLVSFAQLYSAFKDGTTHIVMSPLEFMQRLAALVPRPRLLNPGNQ